MKTLKLLSAVGIIAIILSGCAGKDGATGPAGPAGANGTSGLTVTDYTLTSGSWANYNATTWTFTTSNIIPTTDMAMVYVSLNGVGYEPLAEPSIYVGGDLLNFVYGTGHDLTLWYYFSGSAPSTTTYIKVMDIPPAAQKQHPNTNWHDYAQVKALLDVQAMNKN